MKNVFKLNHCIILLAMLMLVAACSGDDGLDGTDGQGFSNQAKNGTITLEFTGKTPDGKDVSEKQVFAYCSPIMSYKNECRPYGQDGVSKRFYVQRFINPIMGDFGGMYNVMIELDHEDNTFYLYELAIITDFVTNNKIVTMGNDFASLLNGEGGVNIPDYSYDPATGKLKFTLQTVLPANATTLGSELNLKVSADVIVYQELEL